MINPADLTRGFLEPFCQEESRLLITFTGPVPALVSALEIQVYSFCFVRFLSGWAAIISQIMEKMKFY